MSALEREQSAIQALLASPTLGNHIRQLSSLHEAEQAQRRQFQDDVSPNDKSEFINGEIIMHSPVRLWHARASSHLNTLLNLHISLHNVGGFVGIEKLMISLTRNDYEPDVCYFSAEKADLFTDEQTLFPAPDFIAEVLSPSTESRDRGIKFEDYARHGVHEYWLIDPANELIEQYLLRDTTFVLNQKVQQGQVTSTVVSEFTIPVAPLFQTSAFKAAKLAIIKQASS